MLEAGDVAVEFECLSLTRTQGSKPEDEGPPDLAVCPWRLADGLARGPVLLMFVKVGCPTCEYSLPLIDRIFRNYPQSSVSMVVAQERESGARRLIREGDLHLTVGLDSSPHSIGESYGVSYVPTFFLHTTRWHPRECDRVFCPGGAEGDQCQDRSGGRGRGSTLLLAR